ncbi:hypothetical protein [Portibacter marinus]|uniref:hypothetical protein n=1 Tax=Portibacter marinus TaxID=2898660 RepID=UPI001F39A3CA|nr:hypothetical protein [Portibacter marinus]
MKHIYFTLALFIAGLVNAQKSVENKEAKEISKHEVGISFNNSLRSYGFAGWLHYRYYYKDNKIFNTANTGAYSSFYSGFNAEIWYENRKYFGQENKWFLRHGVALTLGYSRYRFANLAFALPEREGFGGGIGYNFGIGYEISDHFNLTATFKPKLLYGIYDLNNFNKVFSVATPLSLGVNYRF